MTQQFCRIRAGIHCYLLRGRDGFVLIDTGPKMSRRRLLRGLEQAGCGVGDLRLVVVTHADADHIGNCVLLREIHGARIAAHELEARAIETKDAFTNRGETPDRIPWSFGALAPLGALLARTDPFVVDLLLEDEQSLAGYGVDASVLHLPGHSKGSLGVLTRGGDLFCGDLFWSYRRPKLHPLIDDLAAARRSVQRLKGLPVTTIHPAHGKPFSASMLDQELPA